jgi:hypothetical protein
MIARFTRKDFLEAIFSPYYKEHRGFILVKSLKRGDPKMSTRYFPNIDILAKEHYGDERDVYFGICPRERMKAEKEHIHYALALWADLDIGPEGHEEKRVFFEGPQQAARAIRSFPRAPSIIVESGRGAHLYWLLKQVTEVRDPERMEKILTTVSDHIQCDTDISLDTVLRLPETVNTKVPGRPVNCDVKFINTNFRYNLEDFENLGQKIVVPVAKPMAASALPGSTGLPTFNSEAGEDFNRPPQALSASSQTDSLVLDETIIDELIDDMSMAASVVTEVRSQREDAPMYTGRSAMSGMEMAHPTRITTSVIPPAIPTVSSVLARLSSERTEVEISLLGSTNLIIGVLVWNENGLIGVESGADLYTIPVSSVAFIKSKAQ